MYCGVCAIEWRCVEGLGGVGCVSFFLYSIHNLGNSAHSGTMKEHKTHYEHKAVVSLSSYLWRIERIRDGAARVIKSSYRNPSY